MKQITAGEVRPRRLTLEYSVLMGAYWAAFGCVYSFANVLLPAKGFSSSQVGIAIAIGNVLGLIFQPVFAGIADKSKKLSLMSLTAILSVIGAILFGLIWFIPNIFLLIMALFCISNALMQIIQPLTYSISVYYVNQKVPVNFGIARGVGSVAFAVLTMTLGKLVDVRGTACIIIGGVCLILLMAIVLWILPRIRKDCEKNLEAAGPKTDTTLIPDSTGHSKSDFSSVATDVVPSGSSDLTGSSNSDATSAASGLRATLSFIGRYKRFFIFLIGATLIFTYHNMVNNFLLNIVEQFGGTTENMGTAMAIAAACELLTMSLFDKLVKKINVRKLLVIASVFFTIKGVIYLFLCNVPFLYGVQVIQIAAYALFIPASVYYVNEIMAPEDKFKGQALSVGATTLGGLLGSLVGGFLIDGINVRAMLVIGLVISAVGTAIVAGALVPTFKDKKEAAK